MPRAWSQKDERQYKRILKSCRKTKCERKGKRSTCKLSEKELEACKRVAAATVNKRRREEGRTKTRGVHLRGLEGALTSGSFAGAPGKIVRRDMSPEKIELGAIVLDEEGQLWTDETRTKKWVPDWSQSSETRIQAMRNKWKNASFDSDRRYALRELEELGVLVPPSLLPPERPKPILKPALFHATPAFALTKIKREGLKPRRGEGLYKHGGYDWHSQGKLFFADNFSAAQQWEHKVEMQLHNQYDAPSKHKTALLRVKQRETELDPIGDRDVRGSRFTTERIPPSDIEFYDVTEERWRPIKEYRRGRAGSPSSAEEAHEGIEGLRGLGYRRAGRVTKMCPALRFDAGEYDAGVEITVFTVPPAGSRYGGAYAGRIDAEIHNGDLQVTFSEVEPEFRRCGVGTRLYETLMRIAQKKKLRLVSDSQRSEGAETFWQKQVKKNRAECIDDRGGHKYTPGSGVEPNVWPCRRFALKRRVRSLRGTKGLMGLTEVEEYGVRFKTGEPVTVRFVRNTKKAPNFGPTYQQDIEPAGRYLIHNPEPGDLPMQWERGEVRFSNPLVLEFNERGEMAYDKDSWKAYLSRKYGGKKGKALSRAIKRDGYDGIVTVQQTSRGARYTGEIVDLTRTP